MTKEKQTTIQISENEIEEIISIISSTLEGSKYTMAQLSIALAYASARGCAFMGANLPHVCAQMAREYERVRMLKKMHETEMPPPSGLN